MISSHALTDFEMEIRKHIEQCGVPYIRSWRIGGGVHANQIGGLCGASGG